ncbi:glycosyltransferase [Massilia psychrophila]|uniref:Glycosyl transferase family 1 domain-containing protein n=1 Tax=Massilia psychrophila TaxID=1603353 RepID=A0A2G8T1R5_9BURK|nr:glycosyltransferase [Massilia psychrophila]PIL39954.1 hypothetical protein CR103_09515 [Massilia psychrophila]GGE78474.1 hypothetical protein GCM10008020_24030 [Massilia psychrophila]
MIRVLVVNIHSSGGGAETVLNNLKDAVGSSGRALQVDSLSKGEFDLASVATSKLVGYAQFVREIRSRSAGYDFIVSGVEGVPFLLCAAALLGLKKPRLIMWLHCSAPVYLKFQGVKSRLAIGMSLRLAQRVICAAPGEARRLAVTSKQVLFLPNIRRVSTQAVAVITRMLPRLVFIGSFAPLKQPHKVLEVLHALITKGDRNYHADFFGAGGLLEEIVQQIEMRGIVSRVTLHGFVADPWASVLPGSILLLPSLTEAMPMVVLEAIEKGCVVIANRFDGYDFFDRHCGMFLSADFNDISQVLPLIHQAEAWSPEELAVRGANSGKFLKREFDNSRSINMLHGYFTSQIAPE